MSTSYGKLFLVVISIFSLLFIAYLFYAGHTLRSSQERIKDYYTEHINKIDSVYCGISKYNLAWITETKKIYIMWMRNEKKSQRSANKHAL